MSPPSSDLSATTLSIVQVFWGLDKKLAQQKHFPSVNWSLSYSKYIKVLEQNYETTEPGFVELRSKTKEILQKEENLAEIAQLVGKSALNGDGRITLEVTRMLNEGFLQQNGMFMYDRFCPFYKTSAILRNLVAFHDVAQKAIIGGDVTFAKIRESASDIIFKLSQMRFEVLFNGLPTFVLCMLIKMRTRTLPSTRFQHKRSIVYLSPSITTSSTQHFYSCTFLSKRLRFSPFFGIHVALTTNPSFI